ncbi:type II toxin-antitoxin system RelE/ParE family toxin [Phyllobacterium sp. SB3]|uniref:type II toxin-antitoxin system RelE/ParE family toxin n=1 Tax=Phyllobacterium sp. SB3 TaxID=3156073 RepID=UPI0032AF94F5
MIYKIDKTATFVSWIDNLSDLRGRAKIMVRLSRLIDGNFGDCKYIGGDVSELRVNFGPGYRVYFTKQENVLILLLCGGDKSTQARDIRKAQLMSRELKERRT